jgi:ABC-type multidrug transport system fused ATPase/permease subunit
MTPINLLTAVFYLYTYIGVSFIFGIALLGVCFYIDRKVDHWMHAIHFENGKIHEKKNNMTNETFESMKTIKLYGWDNYFKREILKLMEEERDAEEKIENTYRMLHFMWEFLPRMIAPVTFFIFMSFGYSINFTNMMEVIMLLGMI